MHPMPLPNAPAQPRRAAPHRGPATLAALLVLLFGLATPRLAAAHCDSLEGPVVIAARAALASGEITPVLRWVPVPAEAEVRSVFARVLAVRATGEAARELADQFFFETLVRLHREGEGFAYTGLLPAGTPIAPAIRAGEAALASGDTGPLVAHFSAALTDGLRERLAEARKAAEHADHNVDAGRHFVAAYVTWMHYLEGLEAATSGAGHAAADGAATAAGRPAHQHP